MRLQTENHCIGQYLLQYNDRAVNKVKLKYGKHRFNEKFKLIVVKIIVPGVGSAVPFFWKVEFSHVEGRQPNCFLRNGNSAVLVTFTIGAPLALQVPIWPQLLE